MVWGSEEGRTEWARNESEKNCLIMEVQKRERKREEEKADDTQGDFDHLECSLCVQRKAKYQEITLATKKALGLRWTWVSS